MPWRISTCPSQLPPNPRQAPVQRRLVGLDQPERNAGIEQSDGDPPHGARADHGSLVERAGGGGWREAVHLAGRAFREEGMPEPLRLWRLHELEEGAPLDGKSFIEGFARRFDRVYRA